MRNCLLCQHTCVFSAIACECNRTSVACIRHYHLLCKCPKEKNYLLEWASTKEHKAVRAQVKGAFNHISKEAAAALRNVSKEQNLLMSTELS